MRALILLSALAACDGADTTPAPEAAPAPAPAPSAEKAEAVAARKAPKPPPSPPGTWSQLRAERADAASFLRSNWNKYNENYHPNYILDGNPKTAWVEGADGNGEGEWLQIPLSALPSARALKVRIRNGYQKSDTLLTANAAPKTLTLTAMHHHATVAQQTFPLDRAMGWQELILPIPDGKGLDLIELRVESTHAGSKYEDTCISDVELFVDSSVPYSASQEQQKHAALMSWVDERVETARFFASEGGGYPFTSTHFDSDGLPTTQASAEAAMQPGRQQLAALQEVEGWLALSAAHALPALPDGLWLDDSLRPMFTPQGLSFSPATEALAGHDKEEEKDGEYVIWSNETWRSNVKVARGADQELEAIYFWIKGIEEGRGTYESKTEYVVHYRDGALDWIYSRRAGGSEMGLEVSEEMITFQQRGTKLAPVQRDALSSVEVSDVDFVDRSQFRG